MTFIENPLFVLAILCLNVVISEWLVEKTFFLHLGTALLVIVITAILANLKIIPTASDESALYGAIFTYIAPISIFYLLLSVNLRQLKEAGLPMLIMFLIGTAGTVLGVIVGMQFVNGAETLGSLFNAIGGMYTATYTGGGINFNAVALHYKVMEEGVLFAGAVAVDNIMTTLWMIATIIIPKMLWRFLPAPAKTNEKQSSLENSGAQNVDDRETINPFDLGIMLALGLAVLWISNLLADAFTGLGISVPSILILTTIALVMAQFPVFQKLRGNQVLGMFTVYLFLAVVGAYCELAALGKIGDIGITLLWFATILVLVHGLLTFGFGIFLKQDWDLVAVASQANIGGSTSALALAKSFGRNDLLLPAILVGSLGNGIGTYLGFIVAGML